MNIPPILPIGILLGIMLSSRMYPKQTMIVIAAAILLVLLYPLIMIIRAANISICPA